MNWHLKCRIDISTEHPHHSYVHRRRGRNRDELRSGPLRCFWSTSLAASRSEKLFGIYYSREGVFNATDSFTIAILSHMNQLQTVSFLRLPIYTSESRTPQQSPFVPPTSTVPIHYTSPFTHPPSIPTPSSTILANMAFRSSSLISKPVVHSPQKFLYPKRSVSQDMSQSRTIMNRNPRA
jgi:hypothetical protein